MGVESDLKFRCSHVGWAVKASSSFLHRVEEDRQASRPHSHVLVNQVKDPQVVYVSVFPKINYPLIPLFT